MKPISHSRINFSTRLNQANTRLKHICLLHYQGQLSRADFREERREILNYIEKSAK